jgi:hypothetical protein
MQRDPLGYADGMSLYEYATCRVTSGTDPLGTKTCRETDYSGFRETRLTSHHTGEQFVAGREAMKEKIIDDLGQEYWDYFKEKWEEFGRNKKPQDIMDLLNKECPKGALLVRWSKYLLLPSRNTHTPSEPEVRYVADVEIKCKADSGWVHLSSPTFKSEWCGYNSGTNQSSSLVFAGDRGPNSNVVKSLIHGCHDEMHENIMRQYRKH